MLSQPPRRGQCLVDDAAVDALQHHFIAADGRADVVNVIHRTEVKRVSGLNQPVVQVVQRAVALHVQVVLRRYRAAGVGDTAPVQAHILA